MAAVAGHSPGSLEHVLAVGVLAQACDPVLLGERGEAQVTGTDPGAAELDGGTAGEGAAEGAPAHAPAGLKQAHAEPCAAQGARGT